MIKVKISNNIINISGHANYDICGKDIVCAAVSSCVLTTINGILSFDEKWIKVIQKENLTIEILVNNNTVNKLINNMINMLEELERDYSNNIKIYKEG